MGSLTKGNSGGFCVLLYRTSLIDLKFEKIWEKVPKIFFRLLDFFQRIGYTKRKFPFCAKIRDFIAGIREYIVRQDMLRQNIILTTEESIGIIYTNKRSIYGMRRQNGSTKQHKL